jgi:hypothetical protein
VVPLSLTFLSSYFLYEVPTTGLDTPPAPKASISTPRQAIGNSNATYRTAQILHTASRSERVKACPRSTPTPQTLHVPASARITMVPYPDDSLQAYIKSRYMAMLLKDVSIWNNLFAISFNWILLAGFLVLPGSFETLDNLPINVTAFKDMLAVMMHLPL